MHLEMRREREQKAQKQDSKRVQYYVMNHKYPHHLNIPITLLCLLYVCMLILCLLLFISLLFLLCVDRIPVCALLALFARIRAPIWCDVGCPLEWFIAFCASLLLFIRLVGNWKHCWHGHSFVPHSSHAHIHIRLCVRASVVYYRNRSLLRRILWE